MRQSIWMNAVVVGLAWAATAVAQDGAKDPDTRNPPPAAEAERPLSALDLVKRGDILRARGDLDAALKDYDLAIARDPSLEAAHAGRAEIFSARKDYDRAIAELIRAREIDWRSQQLKVKLKVALQERAVLSLSKRDYDSAVADYNQIIALSLPEVDKVYAGRGRAFLAKGDLERAASSFTTAIAINRKDPALNLERAAIYARKGDHDNVIDDCNVVLSSDPKSLQAYLLRAAAYAGKKDNAHAAADYRAALSIDPKNAEAKEGAKRVPEPEPTKPEPQTAKSAPGARDMQPMRVTLMRTGTANCEPACAEWISAEGRMDGDTVDRFRKVLKDIGSRRIPIFVDSPGGSVEAGIEVGRMIRAKGLDVFVTRTEAVACEASDKSCREAKSKGREPGLPRPHLARCASSCAFILAGGARRYVGRSSVVGVHQIASFQTRTQVQRTYQVKTRYEKGVPVEVDRTLVSEKKVSETTSPVKTSETTYAKVRKFFTDMGIGDGIMPILLSTPHSEIHWLTRGELTTTKLATDEINGEQFLAGITTPTWTEADRQGLREAIEAVRAREAAARANAASKSKSR